MNLPPLLKKALAEFLGVTLFLTAIIGQVNNANTPFGAMALAIVLGLAILVTGPISGGHLNPAVSVYFFSRREISLVELLSYLVAQIAGAFAGAFIASQMWATQFVFAKQNEMPEVAKLISEVVITGGLVWLVGRLASTGKGAYIPAAVGLWIFAGSVFSSSGAQGNPAVTFGLIFVGQGTSQAAGFVLAQLLGMLIAAVFVVIFADKKTKAVEEK